MVKTYDFHKENIANDGEYDVWRYMRNKTLGSEIPSVELTSGVLNLSIILSNIFQTSPSSLHFTSV